MVLEVFAFRHLLHRVASVTQRHSLFAQPSDNKLSHATKQGVCVVPASCTKKPCIESIGRSAAGGTINDLLSPRALWCLHVCAQLACVWSAQPLLLLWGLFLSFLSLTLMTAYLSLSFGSNENRNCEPAARWLIIDGGECVLSSIGNLRPVELKSARQKAVTDDWRRVDGRPPTEPPQRRIIMRTNLGRWVFVVERPEITQWNAGHPGAMSWFSVVGWMKEDYEDLHARWDEPMIRFCNCYMNNKFVYKSWFCGNGFDWTTIRSLRNKLQYFWGWTQPTMLMQYFSSDNKYEHYFCCPSYNSKLW